jgi:hypothetical protein
VLDKERFTNLAHPKAPSILLSRLAIVFLTIQDANALARILANPVSWVTFTQTNFLNQTQPLTSSTGGVMVNSPRAFLLSTYKAPQMF